MCGNCYIIGKKSAAKALLTTHESWSWLSVWKCWRVCHPYIEGIRRWAIKNLPFTSSWKDLMILRRFGGQPLLRRILKSPSLPTKFLPGQRWGQWWRFRCTIPVSVPYSFLVIFWWWILLLIVLHGNHTVTLDNLSPQTLGDALEKLDQAAVLRDAIPW